MYSPIFYYILTTVSYPSSPSSPFSPTTPPLLFRKGQASCEYQPNKACQVAVRLETSIHIKAGQGNSVRGKGSQKQAKDLEKALFPLLGDPQEDQATQL